MRSISRASGLLALAPLVLAAACSDPELASELDSEGAPEVTEVNVVSDSAELDPNGNATEAATFCRPGDEFKVSTFYCPEDRDETDEPIPGAREKEPVMDATPASLRVRVIFSELLDPSIETLVEENGVVVGGSLADSQPFTLTCGDAEIPYDGFLDPGGSHLSFPPGPSLVVEPTEYVAAGTEDCAIELKSGVITDKDGEAVPDDQLGPYAFGVAAMAFVESAPADEDEGVDPASTISITFNAPVQLNTVEGQITVNDGDADVPVQIDQPTDEEGNVTDPSILEVTPEDGLAPETTYTVTIDTGITDPAGGAVAEGASFSFTTGEASE
jgi:Bacterial Ig-like domain